MENHSTRQGGSKDSSFKRRPNGNQVYRNLKKKTEYGPEIKKKSGISNKKKALLGGWNSKAQ